MANIRDLNRKINSLRNMQKVMSAMNMIASIKLRKLLRKQNTVQTFLESLNMLEENIYNALQHSGAPLVVGYKNVKKINVVLFTADKGLCGSHNNSIRKTADALIEKYEKKSVEIDFTCVGTKGALFCRQKKLQIVSQQPINEREFAMNNLQSMSESIFERFMNNEIQLVLAVYNRFQSTIQQTTTIDQLLPFMPTHEVSDEKEKRTINATYTEPSEEAFIPEAAKLYLYYRLQTALLNSRLSENAARMTAMENATNNSEDLIHRYGRARNRVRQASITNELIEIISGKEAMKR